MGLCEKYKRKIVKLEKKWLKKPVDVSCLKVFFCPTRYKRRRTRATVLDIKNKLEDFSLQLSKDKTIFFRLEEGKEGKGKMILVCHRRRRGEGEN